MSHRYQVVFIERVARKVTINVDFPCKVPVQEVYHSARRLVTEQVRQRENDQWYQPDLQTIGTHYLGGSDDGQESAPEGRESVEEVAQHDASGGTSDQRPA